MYASLLSTQALDKELQVRESLRAENVRVGDLRALRYVCMCVCMYVCMQVCTVITTNNVCMYQSWRYAKSTGPAGQKGE
jgi:hypothetical protein